jgi:DNA topoisomerase IB
MRKLLAASADDAQRLSFLRSLALAAYREKHSRTPPDADLIAQVKEDIRPAVAFLKALGIPTKAYAALMQATAHPGSVLEAAKDFRAVFYPVYRETYKTRVNVFGPAHQAFLDKVLAYFNTKSENAFNETRNTVSGLGDVTLNKRFAMESTKTSGVNLESLFDSMRSARKDGRKTLPLVDAPLVMQAYKAKHPDEYAQWYDAYKALRNVFRDRVKVAVRQAGNENGLMSIAALRKKFAASDYPDFVWFFAKGLDDFYVNEDNKLHTKEGAALVTGVGSLVEPIPATQYTLNKAYSASGRSNPAYMHYPNSVGTGDTGLYLANNRKESKQAADAAIAEIMKKWPSVSPKIFRDLSGRDFDKRVAATVVELIYQVAARIGGDGLTKVKDDSGAVVETPTYGISSILRRHVKVQGNKVVIEYPGKKHVAQHHTLDPSSSPAMAQIVANVKEFMRSKKPDEPVFTTNDGKRIAPTAVNAYLRSFGFTEPKVSVHKLRHVNGDSIVGPLFEAYTPPAKLTQDGLKKAFVDIMTQAGEKLGHKSGDKVTWTTAHKSYVSPQLQAKFFTDRGFLPTKQVQQLMRE